VIQDRAKIKAILTDKTWLKTNIVQILQRFGVTQFTCVNEEEIRCTCPIHGGDNPTSFILYLGTMKYCCYSKHCQDEYGNSINDLIRVCREKGTLDDATKPLSQPIVASTAKKYRLSSMNQSWFEPYRKYQETRGICSTKTFSFKSNVIYSMMDRILFLMYDFDNRKIEAITGRTCNGDETKWKHIYTKNVSHIVYYPHSLAYRNFDTCFLVEGPIDAIKVELAMGLPCIGLLSNAATYQRCQKIVQHFKNIFIVPDHDPKEKAGIKGALKTQAMLGEFGIEARILKLTDESTPEKVDPGQLDTQQLKDILFCQL
jgi:hypothetical protein